ncbi:MAG: hypothetical protein GC154_12675 [bacterium]|nr:hypothetical protein [bacterium]
MPHSLRERTGGVRVPDWRRVTLKSNESCFHIAGSPLAPRWFWLGAALFLLIVGAVRIAPPDLAFYYSFGHSLVYDCDFYFGDEFSAFPFAPHELYRTPGGPPANDWPMGAGVIWTPLIALAAIIRPLSAACGAPVQTGGFSWLDYWTVTYGASLIYGFGGIWLSYYVVRNEGYSTRTSLWAAALIAAGSSVTYHLYVNSADSHPPSAFFIALYLLAWQRYRTAPSAAVAWMGGLALGLAALVRPHNALFALTPLLDGLLNQRRRNESGEIVFPFNIRHLALTGAGAAIAFAPQLMVWKTLYGSWLAIPRSGDVRWLHPHLYDMLFSDFHGMISWSPLFGLAILGLFVQRRHWPYLVPLLLTIYVYACNIAWWAGGSFGNRRMVSCAPIFILGLAALFDVMPKIWLKGLAIGCAVWTWLLLNAEMGGAIQLDHYQNWEEILHAIPQGFTAGLVNHLTRGEWDQHAVERIIAAMAVLALTGGLAWAAARWGALKRFAWITCGAAVLLAGVSAVAAWRTPGAINPREMENYIPRDRFTWVVYFERGYYTISEHEYTLALESMVAATVTEPRHPQAWLYAGIVCDVEGQHRLAYFYYREAFIRGSRSDLLFDFYLDSVNHMLRREPNAARLNERGVILTLRGDFDLARADFELALKTSPDFIPAEENLKSLEARRMGQHSPLAWE